MSAPWLWLTRLFTLITALVVALVVGSCGNSADSGGDGGLIEPACSCTMGEKRCQGTTLQICEFQAVLANCSATASPTDVKAKVFLTEPSLGYSFTIDLLCKNNNFNFTGTIYPGTYQVAVRGEDAYYDNLPTQAFTAVSQLQFP